MSAGDQFGFLEAGGISVDLAGIPGMSQYRPTVQLYDLSTVSDCDLCILLRRHRQVTVRSPVSHIRDLRSLSTARHTRKVKISSSRFSTAACPYCILVGSKPILGFLGAV